VRSNREPSMVHQRVELNAMASEQFVACIERKLAEHGIKKIVPVKETLDEAYRLFERGRPPEGLRQSEDRSRICGRRG
jgi:hypothetical protein